MIFLFGLLLLIVLLSVIHSIEVNVIQGNINAVSTSAQLSHDDYRIVFAYMAVCVVAKDELDIVEFIEYHRAMGVGKFYIFDVNSETLILDSIKHFVTAGLAEYSIVTKHSIPLTDRKSVSPVNYIYDHCLSAYKDRHQFMAFLDVDQFIVVPDKSLSVTTVLQRYEEYGALTLNWRVFGSSGHLQPPLPHKVLSSYSKCYASHIVQPIVNTNYVTGIDPLDAHLFSYKRGATAVDTNFRAVYNATNPSNAQPPVLNSNLFDVMFINHYVTRGKEDPSNNRERVAGDLVDVLAESDCGTVTMPLSNFELIQNPKASIK